MIKGVWKGYFSKQYVDVIFQEPRSSLKNQYSCSIHAWTERTHDEVVNYH